MKNYFYILLLIFSVNTLIAQVGINTEYPNENSLLHISEKNGDNSSSIITSKGIMIPRLTENERNILTYENGITTNSIRLTSNDEGLMIFNTTDKCYNLWNNSELEWKSICGSLGNSIFDIQDCSTTTVFGEYSNNIELTSSNYIKISVNVTKPGSYSIIATTENNNGYFFQANGTFIENGTYTVYLMGVGTPKNFTPDGGIGDQIIIRNGSSILCDNIYIKVLDSAKKPEYTISCQNINIGGAYSVNTTLDNTNIITLTIESTENSIGSSYNISTEIQNGYSFSGSGLITSTSQQVILYGNGTPLNNGTDKITLITNSTLGKASCSLAIKVAPRLIKILGLTNNNNPVYNIGIENNSLQRFLYNPTYFGNNQGAIYPVKGFSFSTINTSSIVGNTNIINTINNFNPDIILIQYNYVANSNDAIFLKELVDKGVVVIYCSDGDGATATRNVEAANISNVMLGETGINSVGTSSNYVETILDTNTAITNGPFMNIVSKGISVDAGNNFGLSTENFPYEKADIIAYQTDSNANNTGIRAFVSKINGFVFIGDGAPFAINSSTNTQSNHYPAKWKFTNGYYYAIPNTYSTPYAYNSFLFLNLITWAINYVQEHRP